MRNRSAETLGPCSIGCRARRFSRDVWPSMMVILLCLLIVRSATAESKARNVLVLFSAAHNEAEALGVLEPEIRERVQCDVNFYTSFTTTSE
jgi:hypothetical protein